MSQDEPRAWLWLRDTDGWTGPTMIDEPNGMVSVPALGLAIPLAALYPQARSG